MDGWNTIVSRCFSFSLGYVSFLEGGEWWGTFFEGLQKIQSETFGGQHTFPFNNHGTSESWCPWQWQSFPVQNRHCPFQNHEAVVGFQWSLIPACQVTSFASESSLYWILHGFFSMSSFKNGSIYVQRAYRFTISAHESWKKTGALRGPSFLPQPREGALCDFLHLLGLTLQGVGFSLRCDFFWVGNKKSSSDTHEFVVCCGWFVEVTPLVCGLSWVFFFGSATCRMQKLET